MLQVLATIPHTIICYTDMCLHVPMSPRVRKSDIAALISPFISTNSDYFNKVNTSLLSKPQACGTLVTGSV